MNTSTYYNGKITSHVPNILTDALGIREKLIKYESKIGAMYDGSSYDDDLKQEWESFKNIIKFETTDFRDAISNIDDDKLSDFLFFVFEEYIRIIKSIKV